MTNSKCSLLTLQQDAIGVSECVIFGDFPDGERADRASDAFWFLTDAMRQTEAHLAQRIKRDDLDRNIATHALLLAEARADILKLF